MKETWARWHDISRTGTKHKLAHQSRRLEKGHWEPAEPRRSTDRRSMEPRSPRRQLAEESKLDHVLVEEARGAAQALCGKQKHRVARSWTLEVNRLLASSSSEAESDADTEENSPRKTNSPRTLKGKLQRAQTELVTARHGRRRRRELGSSSSLLHSEREHTAHRAQELRRQNQELTHALQAQKAARERANAQTEALKQTLKQEWEEKTALMARYRADVKAIEHKLQKVRSACKDADLRVELAQEAQMRAEIERDRAREESNKRACALEATQDTVLAQTAELNGTRARLCNAKNHAAQLADTVSSLEHANQALSDKLDTVRTELQDLTVQFHQQSIQLSLRREQSQIVDENDTSMLQTKCTPSQVCQESKRQRDDAEASHQELVMTRHEAASSSTDIASARENTLPVQRQLESVPEVGCSDCKQNDDEHEQKDATCIDKNKEWEKKLLAVKQEEQRKRDKLCEDYEDKIANLTKECQTWREDARSKSQESQCELGKLREEYEKKLVVLTETSKEWQEKSYTAHEEGQCKLENIRKNYEVKITLLTNECKHWQEEASRKCQANQCEIEALRTDYEATVATLTKECAKWQEEALSESQKAHLHQRELKDEYKSKLVSLQQERQALQKEVSSLQSALLAIQSDRAAQPRASDIVALETKYWRAVFARTVDSLSCATLTSKESQSSDSATTTTQAPFDAWRECSALRLQLNERARVLAERDVQLEQLGQRKSNEEKLRQELVASEQEVVCLRSELAAAGARAEFETAQHRELVVKAASLESRLKDRVHQLEAECAQLADKTAASQDALLKLQVCHEKTYQENEKLKRKANLATRSNTNLVHKKVQAEEIRSSRRRSKRSSSQTMDRGLGDKNNDQKETLAADNVEKPEIVLPRALKVLELTRKQLSRERVRLTLAVIAALSARDRFDRLQEEMDQLEESNSYRSAECCASPCAECAATQVMLVDAVREKKRLAAQLAHEMQLREAHTQKIDKHEARRKMLVGDLERALADRDESRAALERAYAYQKRFDRDKSKLEAKIDALEIELQTQREQVVHLTQNKQDQGVVIAALEREMQVHHECLETTQEEAARVIGVLKESQHLAHSRLLALQRQETELDSAKEELVQRNERIRNVEMALAAVTEQCAEQERQFASRESALLEEIGVGQRRLSATLEELHARQLALETSKEAQERLKMKLSHAESASTHREGARQRATQLEQHLHTKQLQVDTLTSQVQQMEREIARHAEIAASRLGRVETLQRELDAVAQAYSRSEADLEAAMEDLALARSKGSRLEEAVTQARGACALAEDARGELVQRSELLETDVRGLRAENEQLRECLRTSRTEIKVLTGVQKSLAARDAELALAQDQNVDYAQRIAELEAAQAVADEARQCAEEETKRTRADVQLLTTRNLELRADFGKLERAHSQAQSRLGELRDVETQHASLQRAAQILQQSLLQMTGRFQDAETRRRRTETVSRVLLVQVLQFRFCERKMREIGEKYTLLQVHAKEIEEENKSLNALRDTLMKSSKEHAIREARLESELAACKREASEVEAALQVAGARQNELEAERVEWLESLQRMESQALQMDTVREETRAEASRLRTLASQLDAARSELGERTRELRKGESALRKRVAVLELQQAKVDDAQAGLSQIQALTAQLRVQESANEVLRSRLGEAKPSHASPRPRMRLACDVATSPVRLRSSPPGSPTTSSKIITKEAAVPTPTFLDVCKSEAGTQVDLVPSVAASIGNNQADKEASMAREALLRALEAKSSALEAKSSALEDSLQQARAEKTALVAILTRTQGELLEE